MPTMVMSHPPKTTGTVMRSKRPKKADNILPISYMYVGTPKKKFTFYVRERLVYRSNVEVTYEDVFNYLINACNDETISLHYSVNGTYVPITTTGQLHTFIRHVHTDSNAFLYVENNDYVWNVTPQSKGHKMVKRNPESGVADPDLTMSEDESQDGDTVEEENSQYEGEEEEEDYDDEEEEGDNDHIAALTDAISRNLELFRSDVGASSPNSNDTTARAPRSTSSAEAMTRLKTILDNAIADGKMNEAPTLIAEHLVGDVWYSRHPSNEKVYKETVEMLKSCIGTGLLHYYKGIISKFAPKQDEGDATGFMVSIDSLGPLVQKFQPAHDSEKLLEFVQNAMIAACNMLECVQHLAQLDKEFKYFDALNDQVVKDDEKKLPENALPSHDEICERLTSAITSAHYGFQMLQPVFPKECKCKPAVTMLIMELEKMLSVMKNIFVKTCNPEHISETKTFIVETLADIMKKYKGMQCKLHDSIEAALRDAEAFKWRLDADMGYEQWAELHKKGEARLNVPQQVKDTLLQCPAPYAAKPADLAMPDPKTHPVSEMANVAATHAIMTPSENAAVGQTAPAVVHQPDGRSVNPTVTDENAAPATVKAAPAKTSSSKSALTPASNVPASTGTAAPANSEKKMSNELRRMIDAMYKSSPNQHNYVYPNPPKAGTIMIPTGGLARCRCSKNCPELLMEPAYEYIERFNEPRQTNYEKTKQKRFKKN